MLGIRERGDSRFCGKIFCLTVPKNLVGEPFCDVFQKNSGLQNVYGKGGGSIKSFRRNFCLTVPKNFVGECFSVSLISGIEKFYASEGYVQGWCFKHL